MIHDIEKKPRGLWYLEAKCQECFQEEEELSHVEYSRQVKKKSRLRLTRVNFRDEGRREIGNSEFSSIEEIC